MMQVLKDIGGVELPDALVKLGASGENGDVAPNVPGNGLHAKQGPASPSEKA